MKLSEANQLLAPGYLPLESGFLPAIYAKEAR